MRLNNYTLFTKGKRIVFICHQMISLQKYPPFMIIRMSTEHVNEHSATLM